MPLTLDAVTQDISTPAGDVGTYTWADVIALNSTKMTSFSASPGKTIYRWTGKITLNGACTLNIRNVAIEFAGSSSTTPGQIIALGTCIVNFGLTTTVSSQTVYREGCELIFSRSYTSVGIADCALTYSTGAANSTTSRVNIYASTLSFNFSAGSRIKLFISNIYYSFVYSSNVPSTRNVLSIQANGTCSQLRLLYTTIEANGLLTLKSIESYIPQAGYVNYVTAQRLTFSAVAATAPGSDYLTEKTSSIDFLDCPSINLANGEVYRDTAVYGSTVNECRKTWSRYLLIKDSIGNVNNAAVRYIGYTNASGVTTSTGLFNTVLIGSETNIASLANPANNVTPYARPLVIVDRSTYVLEIRSYSHLAVSENQVVSETLGSVSQPFIKELTVDPGITQTNTTIVEAYTGIAHTATTITLTQALTVDQIFDSRKLYWRNNTGIAVPYKEGTVLNLNGASLVVNGVTLSATSKYSYVKTTGTITFINGGDSDIPTEDSVGIRTSIAITGLVVGSEVRLYNEATQEEFAGVESCSSTTQTFKYVYTPDVVVTLIVFKTEYVPVRLTGISLSSTAQSIQVQQRFDRIYNNES